jgi:cardiolipin synthase
MSNVRVAIPLYRGKRKFHLEKGRRWSIVEHLVLAALAEQAQSVADLAAAGQMHERLVIEMLIRLMRAGWVELQPTPTELLFAASVAGKLAAAKPELPAAATPVARWMNFVVDRITGTIFKPRELPFLHRNSILERAQREAIVWLQPATFESDYEVEDLVEHLFREDENFIAVERAGDRLMERYALVLVRGGKIERLPERAPTRLVDAVLDAAKQGAASRPGQPMTIEATVGAVTPDYAARRRAFYLADEDILIGGKANEAALLQVIRGARERLIIHSTFVGKPAFDRLKPHLIEAARKGARVELMWGEDDDPRSAGRTRAAVEAIREELAGSGEDELIRLNPFSTHSHAKFVVADRGGGGPIALIGSCNWLSSGMALLEVSLRLRDPRLVADLLYQAAELSRGRDGYWNEHTSQLAAYAASVSDMPPMGASNAEAAIILGPAHRDVLLKASHSAERRVLLMSHRVSASARQAFLIPACSALMARPGLAVELRYGVAPKSPEPGWDAITRDLDITRIVVVPPTSPEAHAKLLAWDENDVVITSQNWLSADPSESNQRREMGIHLCSSGLATRVFRLLGAFNQD